MNKVTLAFLIIGGVAFLALYVHMISLLMKWTAIIKGKTPKKPFVGKCDRVFLWFSLLVIYFAIILFCIFYDADLFTRAQIFAAAFVSMPFNPLVMILFLSYRFLFYRDSELRRDDSQSQDENSN